jgi:uncharacterized peroxidase-related enzyme
MTFIKTIPEAEATGAVAEFYAQDRENSGYVWNLSRMFSPRPEVFAAWKQLIAAINGNMDRRRYELATLAAARHLRSSYCMLQHSSVLLDMFMSADELEAVAADHRDAGLDPVDVAVMDFAEKVAVDATSVTQGDVDGLRAHGLTDAEVLDVVLAAAARSFLCKAMDGVGTQPDPQSGAAIPPDLREALTVGRPIAPA